MGWQGWMVNAVGLRKTVASAESGSFSASLKSLWIPGGGAVSMVCFYLPWGKFSLAFIKKSMSGAAMGGTYWTVFAAALLIAAAGSSLLLLRRHRLARIAIMLPALYGVLFLLIRGAQVSRGVATPFGRIHPQDIGISVQFGWIGTILGFAAALIGAVLLREERAVARKSCAAEREGSPIPEWPSIRE